MDVSIGTAWVGVGVMMIGVASFVTREGFSSDFSKRSGESLFSGKALITTN